MEEESEEAGKLHNSISQILKSWKDFGKLETAERKRIVRIALNENWRIRILQYSFVPLIVACAIIGNTIGARFAVGNIASFIAALAGTTLLSVSLVAMMAKTFDRIGRS